MSGLSLRDSFLRACTLDVEVRKPGNVSRASPGHGMTADQFLASAHAAVGSLFRAGCSVGERIEHAVLATRRVAGCNTNLGILLLCAPLALAYERVEGPCTAAALQESIGHVLRELTVADAAAAFRGIAHANPGGLGRVQAGDVHEAPSITLLDAMRLAADRDRIALQYTTAFTDIFSLGLQGLPADFLASDGVPGALETETVQRVFLHYLATWPDSHIVRKRGSACAEEVRGEAMDWLQQHPAPWDRSESFADWDESLKQRGLNPGTTADLTVATLFVAGLCAAAAGN